MAEVVRDREISPEDYRFLQVFAADEFLLTNFSAFTALKTLRENMPGKFDGNGPTEENDLLTLGMIAAENALILRTYAAGALEDWPPSDEVVPASIFYLHLEYWIEHGGDYTFPEGRSMREHLLLTADGNSDG